jgi:hypothetical protein
MLSHRVFRYLGLALSAAAALSCGDYTSSTSPSQAKVLPASQITGASFSRYILISGAWVCVEGCSLESK